MAERTKPDTKGKIGIKFRNLNVTLFVLVIAVMVYFMLLLINNITTSAARDFVQLYSTRVIGILDSHLGREIALMTKAVRSPAIVEWFADEMNEEKRRAAYLEMASTLDVMQSGSFYLAIEKSRNEYTLERGDVYVGFSPYASLSTERAEDAWYFECVAAEHDYVLNVDIEKFGGRKRVWLNYKVIKNGEVLGALTTGLLFNSVLDELFGAYNKQSVRTFVIDELGVLQMDSALQGDENLLIYENAVRIQDRVQDAAFQTEIEAYLQKVDNLFRPYQAPEIIKLSGADYQYASVASIAGTNWSVVSLYNSDSLFSLEKLWPLLIVIIGVFVLYTAATGMLTRRMLLKPIHRLVESLAEAGPAKKGLSVYGLTRDDEFGTLARTIQDMFNQLEVNNARLLEASEKAEAASKAKSTFLASMSHEIRTPISAIVGMTHIGKKTTEVARKQDCFEKIGVASNHLLGVINDILDISKIEADKFELSLVWFDLEKLLRNVVNVIAFRMAEKKIDFTVSYDLRLPGLIESDDQRLAQVVTNLLSNAVKFTPAGGSVHLAATLENAPAHQPGNAPDTPCLIGISVTDSGIGIAPENMERLFRSFEQAENGTSRTYGGTGLGLAISRHIVEAMGGGIQVESTPGQGACFHVSVPAPGRSENKELPATLRDKIKILAVDPDLRVLDFFRKTAAHFSVHCATAASMGEARALLEKNGGYDISFLAFSLLDEAETQFAGLVELCEGKQGGQNGSGRAGEVVFMADLAQSSAEYETRNAGDRKVLVKPLFPAALLDCALAGLQARGEEMPGSGDPNDPNAPGTQGASGSSGAPGTTDAPDAGSLTGRRILLAEDVAVNQEIFCAMLEHTGVAIDCVENGLAALEAFKTNPDKYDLIMMDVQMPGMDGYQATTAIRALENARAASIPIIAMTANVFREDVEKCLASGMNSHIGKPLDYEILMSTLREYMPRA